MKSAQKPPVTSVPPDTLNSIGVLKRREIEARIIAPLLEAFAAEFGHERVFSIAKDVIVRIVHEQGRELASRAGGCSLAHFAAALGDWTKDNALQLQIVEQSATKFGFNVTRCRYAELYQHLGITELGQLLSCGRDLSLIEGFNPTIKLTRTQTIMEGANHCDFRFADHTAVRKGAPERPTHEGAAARPVAPRRDQKGTTRRRRNQ